MVAGQEVYIADGTPAVYEHVSSIGSSTATRLRRETSKRRKPCVSNALAKGMLGSLNAAHFWREGASAHG
jgi:hypothetical protein